jgi:hypothetical protein
VPTLSATASTALNTANAQLADQMQRAAAQRVESAPASKLSATLDRIEANPPIGKVTEADGPLFIPEPADDGPPRAGDTVVQAYWGVGIVEREDSVLGPLVKFDRGDSVLCTYRELSVIRRAQPLKPEPSIATSVPQHVRDAYAAAGYVERPGTAGAAITFVRLPEDEDPGVFEIQSTLNAKPDRKVRCPSVPQDVETEPTAQQSMLIARSGGNALVLPGFATAAEVAELRAEFERRSDRLERLAIADDPEALVTEEEIRTERAQQAGGE